MRGGRSTDEQIIGVLREAGTGGSTGDLCRRHGISHPRPSTTHERSYGVQPLKPGLDRLLWDWRIDWDRRHPQRIKEANHSTRRNHSKTKPI